MLHERVPDTWEIVCLVPGGAGGIIGGSSKFGTGSGNCTKTEGRSIRIGISKKVGRAGDESGQRLYHKIWDKARTAVF